MDTRQLFKKYYRRVAMHGILKSLLLAFTLGLMVNFVIAFVLWFTQLGLTVVLIVELGALALTTIVVTPILYFTRFRPTTEKIAWLIDRLGLEERIVTMCQMEQDPSYVAMLQREDAKAKLKNVSHRSVKFSISRIALIVLAVTFVFGTSMTTVSALAASGSAKHGGEVFNPPDDKDDPDEEDKKEYVIVTYLAGEGGVIQGASLQKIEKGADAEPVTAVPLDGYRFVVWDDGIMTAQRWDWSVMEDLTVEAQFELIPEDEKEGNEGDEGDEGDDGEGGDDTEDGEDGEDGDDGDDGEKKDDGEGSEGEDNGEDGEGEGDAPGEGDGPHAEGGPDGDGNTDDTSGSGGNGDGDKEGGGPDKGDTHPDNESGAGPGASPGKDHDNNKIIDGNTDYHDVVDTDKNKEELAGDESIPPELKDILDGYFDSLKP